MAYSDAIFQGLNSAGDSIAAAIERKKQRDAFAQFQQTPATTTQYQSQPQGGGVSSVNISQVPNPDYGGALLHYLSQSGASPGILAQMSMELQKQNEPKFTSVPAGSTYGIEQNGHFTPQGTAEFKPQTMFGFGLDGKPLVAQTANGQTTTKPSPFVTPQMQAVQNSVAKAKATQDIAQKKVDISNTSVSAPQLDNNGQMGVVVTDKTNHTSHFQPVGVQGQQKSGSLSGSTKTMLEAAPNVKFFVDKLQKEVDLNKDQLGPAAGRWNEYMTGTIGATNPEFAKLRTNMGLLSTLLMRMHVGARGGEYIMKHFQDLIDQGKSSPENLHAALGEIGNYADQLMQEHGGGTPNPSMKMPTVSSDADYDKLPSGTVFIAPDGKKRTKP